MNTNYGDKTNFQPSYLHIGISYTSMTAVCTQDSILLAMELHLVFTRGQFWPSPLGIFVAVCHQFQYCSEVFF